VAKRQITTWVSEEVYEALKARAQGEQDDLSRVTAGVLARAIADGVQGSPRYAPVVAAFQVATAEAMQGEVNLVAECASKAALYSIAGRLELGQLLIKKLGEGQARAVQQAAWRKAIEELRKPLEGA
jgi:hypothetical protein